MVCQFDSFTIALLTTGDHGRVIQFMAKRTNPLVKDSSNIILSVIGELIHQRILNKKHEVYVYIAS